MKVAVYTAITDRRDTLHPEQCFEGADFWCYADERSRSRRTGSWVYRDVAPSGDPRRIAKAPKVLAHHFLADYDYSLWMDGACRLLCPVESLIRTYLVDADVALFKQPDFDCLYDHADFCMRASLGDPADISAQIKRYWEAGFPAHAGLYEGGVILRRHSALVVTWEKIWWEEIVRGSVRDQLSLPVSLRAAGLTPALFPGSIRHDLPSSLPQSIVRYTPHNHFTRRPIFRP